MPRLAPPLSLLLATPLALLTACTVPVGEPAGEQASAVTLSPDPHTGPPPLQLAPIPHTLGPLGRVNMGSSASQFCTLTAISGAFGAAEPSGTNSFANVTDDGTNFWFITGVGVTATATCVEWSAFSGASTVSHVTTSRSPYWAALGNGEADTKLWGDNSACFISGMSGQWSVAGQINWIDITDGAIGGGDKGSWVMSTRTTGPHIASDANCVSFAGGVQSLSFLMPPQGGFFRGDVFCGIESFQGTFASANDGVWVGPGPGAYQSAYAKGGVSELTLRCIPYAQN